MLCAFLVESPGTVPSTPSPQRDSHPASVTSTPGPCPLWALPSKSWEVLQVPNFASFLLLLPVCRRPLLHPLTCGSDETPSPSTCLLASLGLSALRAPARGSLSYALSIALQHGALFLTTGAVLW